MTNRIPVVDIADLGSRRALTTFDRACREWGVLQVTGHGIDEGVVAAVFAATRVFFAQPRHEKSKILRTADNPYGFYDRELTKNRHDWKEIFDYGPADGALIRPQWPTGLPGFEAAVTAYYRACEDLARRLLGAIAINLGVPAEHLTKNFRSTHTSFLRLNCYPKCPPNAVDPPLGVGQHTDAGALTLLLQDDQPGLEVFREGRWYLVEPRPDALVINVGDMIQVWSNDRYRAALHRVVTNADRDRYSVPFFLSPSYETTYAPLPTTVTASRPARYRAINWREFRMLRAAGDYADFGEEVQISHYRQ